MWRGRFQAGKELKRSRRNEVKEHQSPRSRLSFGLWRGFSWFGTKRPTQPKDGLNGAPSHPPDNSGLRNLDVVSRKSTILSCNHTSGTPIVRHVTALSDETEDDAGKVGCPRGMNPAADIPRGLGENTMKTLDRVFAHRYSDKGQIESICLVCLLTICRCRDAEQVTQEEAKHVCHPDPLPASFHFQ